MSRGHRSAWRASCGKRRRPRRSPRPSLRAKLDDIAIADHRQKRETPAAQAFSEIRPEYYVDFFPPSKGALVGITDRGAKLSVFLDERQLALLHHSIGLLTDGQKIRDLQDYLRLELASAITQENERAEAQARLVGEEIERRRGETEWAAAVVDLALACVLPAGPERGGELQRLAPLVTLAGGAVRR